MDRIATGGSMSDLAVCCSHLHVRYLRRTSDAITTGWWACDYCGTKFVPAGLHNLIVAENKDLHERVAFLESREVCTRPHKDVETCGYCQRDTLAAENERLRRAAKTVGVAQVEEDPECPDCGGRRNGCPECGGNVGAA